MGSDRLSQEELAIVLRRAAELDAESSEPFELGVPVAAIEASAAEVGISPASVQQAVAELRAGMLESADDSRARLAVARDTPLGPEAAHAAIDRYLKRQLFVQARNRGGVEVWKQRADLVAQVQRGFDLAKAVRLKALSWIVVRVVPVEDGSLVRLEAGLNRSVVLAPPIIGGTLAFAGLTGGAVAMVLGEPAIAIWSASTGALSGGAGYAIGRTGVRSTVRKASESLEGFLDALERGEGAKRRGSRSHDRA